LRAPWGNLVNFVATVKAIGQYAGARWRRRSLAWVKTDHVYLPQGSAALGRERLGEMLVRMQCISAGELEDALCACPPGMRLGEYLVSIYGLPTATLYQALSTQTGIPLGLPESLRVSRTAARVLPVEIARRWKVLPYRVTVGQLHVVTANVPTTEMTRELADLSNLEIRFRLVDPREFEALAAEFLPADDN